MPDIDAAGIIPASGLADAKAGHTPQGRNRMAKHNEARDYQHDDGDGRKDNSNVGKELGASCV